MYTYLYMYIQYSLQKQTEKYLHFNFYLAYIGFPCDMLLQKNKQVLIYLRIIEYFLMFF